MKIKTKYDPSEKTKVFEVFGVRDENKTFDVSGLHRWQEDKITLNKVQFLIWDDGWEWVDAEDYVPYAEE